MAYGFIKCWGCGERLHSDEDRIQPCWACRHRASMADTKKEQEYLQMMGDAAVKVQR